MKPGSRLAPGTSITGQPSGTVPVTPVMAWSSISTAVPAAQAPARGSRTRSPVTAKRGLPGVYRGLAALASGIVTATPAGRRPLLRQPPELGVHLLVRILRQGAVQLVADDRELI